MNNNRMEGGLDSESNNSGSELDANHFSAELIKEAFERRELLLWIEERLLGGWTEKNLSPLLDDAREHFQFPVPKWRTVSRWWQVYKTSNFQLVALLPQTQKKGNRSKRLKEEEELLISQGIERWLSPSKPSILAAYKFYCDKVASRNASSKNELPVRSYRIFANRIKSVPRNKALASRSIRNVVA